MTVAALENFRFMGNGVLEFLSDRIGAIAAIHMHDVGRYRKEMK